MVNTLLRKMLIIETKDLRSVVALRVINEAPLTELSQNFHVVVPGSNNGSGDQ